MIVSDTGKWRLVRLIRAGFLLMAFVSIVLSLGAPGLGWVLATVTMVGASLCCGIVGRRWLCICLGVTLLHLFTVGPLAGAPGSSFGSDWLFAAVLTALPVIVGVAALVVTTLRSKK